MHRPDAVVADLAAALGADAEVGSAIDLEVGPEVGLIVDGRPLAPSLPLSLAPIAEGAVVRRADEVAGPGVPRAAWAAVLAVLAGPDAGRRIGLPPGRTLVGGRPPGMAWWADAPRRARLADPTLEVDQLAVDVDADGSVAVRLLGAGSAPARPIASGQLVRRAWRGRWPGRWRRGGPDARRPSRPLAPGEELVLGRTRLRFDPPPPPMPTVGAGGPVHGTIPLHRRVRPAAPPSPPPIDLPPPPPTPSTAVGGIGPVTMAASVLSGVAMVLILHSWAYAAFALLGPLVGAASALDARRRTDPRRRRHRRRRRRALAELDAALAATTAPRRAELAARRPGIGAAATALVDPEANGVWSRRLDDPALGEVRLGLGPVAVAVAVAPATDDRASAPDVAGLLAAHAGLDDVAAGCSIGPGSALAVAGDAASARALVRSLLLQLAVAHGPADLAVTVVAGPSEAAEWTWCRWLPHHRDRPGPALERWQVVVIDDPGGLGGRRSPAREALRLAGPGRTVVPIVLVADPQEAPAACTTVLSVAADGTVRGPGSVAAGPAAADAVHPEVAVELAARLARWEDPELDDPDRDLPAAVALVDLLGREVTTAAGIDARWVAAGADPAPIVSLGVDGDGPLDLDLAIDGPHVLVAGTTGAGKSELLRSLVAGLAAGADPDRLAFVLVDFKGGSAFDACAGLPHVAGLVTDLDARLAARALRGLDAEIRRREAVLAGAGVEDLGALRRRAEPLDEPMPRLVVVVDEYATLAAQLPDFVDALVDVARRGRSLGFHLVLATQRPGGSVGEHLRANTGLRIALRVHAATDSTDVVDDPGAAALPRHRPGRALVRRGADDLVAIQTARATVPAPSTPRRPVTVVDLAAPDGGGPTVPHHETAAAAADAAPTDLDLLVAAARAAWTARGGARPRPPWPEPLPTRVAWPVVGPAGPAEAPADDERGGLPRLVLGRADDPEGQRTPPWWWDPGRGPLLVVGIPGSGTSTTLAVAALTAARALPPDRLRVHVIDLGIGGAGVLAGLPHVDALVAAGDVERQRRLLGALAAELAIPVEPATPVGAASASRPCHLLLVDGLLALRSRWDHPGADQPWLDLVALLTRGTAAGVHVALAAEGPAVPQAVLGAVRQRLVLGLGDPNDAGWLGIAPGAVDPTAGPGRGTASVGPSPVQVAHPPGGVAAAVAALAGRPAGRLAPSAAVGRLGSVERRADLPASRVEPDGTLALVVGRSDLGLAPAVLRLPGGSAALVAGPPRSGRTTALVSLAEAALQAGRAVVVVRPEPGPFAPLDAEIVDPDDHAGLAARLDRPDAPVLVLVDDADALDADHPVLAPLLARRARHLAVVAAGRNDRLRSSWSHWTRDVRADRRGLLLEPDLDLDGDLLGARLPRARPAGLAGGPGRGWLVGDPEGFAQVAVSEVVPAAGKQHEMH